MVGKNTGILPVIDGRQKHGHPADDWWWQNTGILPVIGGRQNTGILPHD